MIPSHPRIQSRLLAEGENVHPDVHVIVVGSDKATFDAVLAILTPNGGRVSWAPNFEALERLSVEDPADAFLIEDLPNLAADDIAQQVEYRSHPAPAIVYIGTGTPSVSKPLQAEDILRVLRRELERRRET
jgi:DNA-binding NtrC family response regulator